MGSQGTTMTCISVFNFELKEVDQVNEDDGKIKMKGLNLDLITSEQHLVKYLFNFECWIA